MIVDVRRYSLKPGHLAPYVEIYGERGFPLQVRHLGPNLGWFVSDVGPQNHIVQLWAYDSLADMESRRSAMAVDEDWTATRRLFTGRFADQQTQLMTTVEGLAYTRSSAVPGLVDIRTYTLHHGELPRFLDLLRNKAAAVQARHWTDNIVYLSSLTGRQNRIMHIWGHKDHAERQARRAALLADPDWQACLADILPMMAHMETLTATPAAFWQRADPT